MVDLKEKIINASLSKKQRIIAEYMLENIDTVGLYTITDLSNKIGVSDTSIIRFVRSIGFSSYSDFKKHLNTRIIDNYSNHISPRSNFIETKDIISDHNIISDVMNLCVENVTKTCKHLTPKLIDDISKTLISANQKYIVGFKTLTSCSTYMTRQLPYLLKNVRPVTVAESLSLERIVDITDQDCILVYGFPPYNKLNFSMLEIAQKKGAKIIIITDKTTSPLSKYADHLITCYVEGVGSTLSLIAPFCITEIILLSISKMQNIESDERAKMLEEFLSETGLY